MMIETVYGDVLDADIGIIVHGCNTCGVMGAGIALQIKNRFPEAYREYRDVYEGKYNKNGLVLGEISLAVIKTKQVNDQLCIPEKIIVNAVTQGLNNKSFDKKSNRQVKYDAVVECFEEVLKLLNYIEVEFGVRLPVLFPMIGAGLGGGSWKIISTIIDETIPDIYSKKLYLYRESEKNTRSLVVY